MQKPENHREAMIVGSAFVVFGGIFTFAGAQFLSVLFSIMCALGLGVLTTALLCLIFDVEWDSEAGIGITTVSMMLSAPFVKFALEFADAYAVPMVSGLCLAASGEVFCQIFSIQDDGFMWKTGVELVCFVLGFLLAQQLQDSIRILVTSQFGGFLVVTGGSILFGKYPTAKNAKDKSFAKYFGHLIVMLLISVVGIYYQRREIQKINSKLAAQSDA